MAAQFSLLVAGHFSIAAALLTATLYISAAATLIGSGSNSFIKELHQPCSCQRRQYDDGTVSIITVTVSTFEVFHGLFRVCRTVLTNVAAPAAEDVGIVALEHGPFVSGTGGLVQTGLTGLCNTLKTGRG